MVLIEDDVSLLSGAYIQENLSAFTENPQKAVMNRGKKGPKPDEGAELVCPASLFPICVQAEALQAWPHTACQTHGRLAGQSRADLAQNRLARLRLKMRTNPSYNNLLYEDRINGFEFL